MDQSGIDNQRIELLGAEEAASLLGVKRETLYAYASRGLVRVYPGDTPRERKYARDDVLRLKTRASARAGHTAVAAGALRWGEPVLDSAVTQIREDGPAYRGSPSVALARTASFEQVAELLWTGALPTDGVRWPGGARLRAAPRARPLDVLQFALAQAMAADERRFVLPDEEEWARARVLIRQLAASIGAGGGRADTVASAIVGEEASPRASAAVNAALIVCADHELNVSSFSARVTASAGADLYACVTSALATFSGPRHGGSCDRVEALVQEVGRPERARAVVLDRARRGEEIPGFGHPLYPKGDPRTPPLLEWAERLGARSPRVRTLRAIVEAMASIGREAPAVDLGVVAVTSALRMAPGMATAVFALGRSAGWIAHALEHRASGVLMRPRARYVGPVS